MNITVAGLGYVGLSLACLLSKHNNVIAIDINENRVADINNGISPIKDAFIEAYLADRPNSLRATTDVNKAYEIADYIVIATPTNYDDVTHYFDTSSIESVLDLVKKINPHAAVVIKSTIPVGYTKDISAKYSELQTHIKNEKSTYARVRDMGRDLPSSRSSSPPSFCARATH